MGEEQLHLTKACEIQRLDKTWAPGSLFVYTTRAVWRPSLQDAGGAGEQTFPLADLSQKRSTKNPLLRLELAPPVMLRFPSIEDRDAATNTMKELGERASAAAAPAAAAGTTGAPPAAAGAPARARAASGSGGGGAGSGAGARGGGPQQLAIPSEEDRRALLNSNSYLATQYERLVRSQTISEAEFWRSPAVRKTAQLPCHADPQQKLGLPSQAVFVHASAHGGLNRLTFSLSREEAAQILEEKPHIKRAFLSQVGPNMNETEFWQRYFRYEMAKKKKRHKKLADLERRQAGAPAGGGDAGGGAADADTDMQIEEEARMFQDEGDEAPQQRAAARRANPALDLGADEGDALGGGYGLTHNSARDEAASVSGFRSLSHDIVTDVNRHSTFVMAAQAGQRRGPEEGAQQQRGGDAGTPWGSGASAAAAEPSDADMAAVGEAMALDDLRQQKELRFDRLKISDPRLYFEGAHAAQHGDGGGGEPGGGAAAAGGGGGGARREGGEPPWEALSRLDPRRLADPPGEPAAAQQVLLELSGGGALGGPEADGRPTRHPRDAIPAWEEELRKHALIVNELLRHFWGCIPCNTDAKRRKMDKVLEQMDLTYRDLNALLERSRGAERAYVSQLVRPMREQLDTAELASRHVKRMLSQKQRPGAGSGGGGA